MSAAKPLGGAQGKLRWSFNHDTLNRLANPSGAQADNPYPNYCRQYDSFGNRQARNSSATPWASTAGMTTACLPHSASTSVYGVNSRVSGVIPQGVCTGPLFFSFGWALAGDVRRILEKKWGFALFHRKRNLLSLEEYL
jgi:hypothetical protein